MTRHDHASRLRCLAVWLLATGGCGGLVPWLLAGVERPAGFETTLVDLMALAGATAVLWLWLLATVTTYDVARGRADEPRAGVPAGVRRAVLAACGVALASSGLALPAHADDGHAHPSVLAGLPMPDRPTTLSNLGLAFQVAQATAHPDPHRPHGEHPHRGPRPARATVIVRDGDTLWAIAQRHLGPAGEGAISRACSRLYQLNRAVIGDDPDLIHPGQRLRLPDLTQEDS
jgi:nucleoid-associated protein YgaU